MGGVDNIRGTAYQQAQALLAALDVLDDADAGGIRIEGVEDIVDIEVFAKDGAISNAKQVKTRTEPYVWAKADLIAVLNKWLALPNATLASFEFVTDGLLGRTGEEIKAALEACTKDDCRPFETIAGDRLDDARRNALSRARVRVDRATTGALLDRAERQVAAMLDHVRTSEDAREQARGAVGRLFRAFFERGGNPEISVRTFDRSELAAILGVSADLPVSRRWKGALRPRYLAAARSSQGLPLGVAKIKLDPMRASGDSHVDLDALLSESNPVLIFGRTGSGKTTAARALRRIGAELDRVVLLAHAESYLAGRIDALSADAISSVLGEDVPAAAGRQALHDRSVILAVDGVSEVPQDLQRALQAELSVLTATGNGAHIVLIGRDVAILREVLPTSVIPRAYSVASLDRDERREMIKKNKALDCETVLFQIDRALGDGAGNPLLFEMALTLASEQKEFSSRAGLYDAFVEQLAERSGGSQIVATSLALGIVFAGLLDKGRRYTDPYEFSQSLLSASLVLKQVQPAIDPQTVETGARRAGLIVSVGYTQAVAPIHDSFADYMAGSAHARGLVHWPRALSPGDEQRVLFGAEIGGCDSDLAHCVARDLPFLAVRISAFEKASCFDETAPMAVETFLRYLLPEGSCCTVSLLRIGDRVVAARHVKDSSGWVDEPTLDAIRRTSSVVVLDSGGPLALAVRLWRHYLADVLRRSTSLQPARPRSRAEARLVLETHIANILQVTTALIARVSPPGHSGLLRKTVGPVGANVAILSSNGGDWPLIYSPSDDVQVRLVEFEDATTREALWDESDSNRARSSRSTVSAYIDGIIVGPEHDLRKAIQSLTLFDWI